MVCAKLRWRGTVRLDFPRPHLSPTIRATTNACYRDRSRLLVVLALAHNKNRMQLELIERGSPLDVPLHLQPGMFVVSGRGQKKSRGTRQQGRTAEDIFA